MRSAPCVSCRPVRDRVERCHAASPRQAQNRIGPPALAARIRFRAAGRTPLTRHRITPRRRRPPTPHGLARDSPCTCRKAPGSVAGEVRLSPDAATPALWWSWSAGLGVRPRGRSPAPARSRVCPLAAHSVPESWCVALGSTCGSCSGRSFSSMRWSCFSMRAICWRAASPCCRSSSMAAAPANRR